MTRLPSNRLTLLCAVLLSSAGLALAGCGDDDTGTTPTASAESEPSGVSSSERLSSDVDATEPTEPTTEDPGDATDPTGPTEPSEPTEPTEPIEPTEPTEPSDPPEPEPEQRACDDEAPPAEDGCLPGWLCMDGLCRVPLQGQVYGETEFEILQPMSLGRLLDTFKGLADATFLVLDGRRGENEERVIQVRYGAADFVDQNQIPPQVRWQLGLFGDEQIDETFMKPAPEEEFRGHRRWVTVEPFRYRLAGIAQVGNQRAGFEMPAEQVTFDVTFDVDTHGAGIVVEGLVTREEAETRRLGTRDDIVLLDFLMRGELCSVNNYQPAGEEWMLADVLDCNEVEMDRDFSGDGELDAYFVRIQGRLARMQLVRPFGF